MTIRYLSMLLLLASCVDQETDPANTDSVDDGLSQLAPPGGGSGPPPPPLCLPASGSVIDHTGTITGKAQTWGGRNIHTVSDDLEIATTVTISPCTHVRIAAGKTITIQNFGKLVAPPSASGPGGQVIERRDAGAWARIRVSAGGVLELHGATVDGGGAVTAAVSLEGGLLIVDNASITNSASYGVVATSTATVNAISGSGLTISGSAAAPAQIIGNLVGQLPSGSYTGNHDNEIEIPTTLGGTTNVVSSTQTWHALGVPYHVTGLGGGDELIVGSPATNAPFATLTIDPATTLRFDRNIKVAVDVAAGKTTTPSGALVALGTAAQPIVFTSAADPAARGDWVGLYFGGKLTSSQSGHTQLDHVVVAFAGGDTMSRYGSCYFPAGNIYNNAAIRMMGGPQPDYPFVTNSMIASSKLHGIDASWMSNGTTLDLTTSAGNSFVDLPTLNVDACAQTYPSYCSMPRCGP